MVKLIHGLRQPQLKVYKHYLELTKEELDEVLDTTIPDCDFPVNMANTLEKYGILTLRDLLNISRDKLLSMEQIGEKSVDKIFKRLRVMGFYIK